MKVSAHASWHLVEALQVAAERGFILLTQLVSLISTNEGLWIEAHDLLSTCAGYIIKILVHACRYLMVICPSAEFSLVDETRLVNFTAAIRTEQKVHHPAMRSVSLTFTRRVSLTFTRLAIVEGLGIEAHDLLSTCAGHIIKILVHACRYLMVICPSAEFSLVNETRLVNFTAAIRTEQKFHHPAIRRLAMVVMTVMPMSISSISS
jgi:hypothetical protein